MKLSIVIPLYNKEQSITRTLDCILNQTFQDFEVVIVDDGSTDNSIKKVREVADSRFQLFQKENGGVSSARNYGIEQAQYEYIAFLDADDYWETNYLEEQAKLINDFPEAGMWGCAWGEINQNKKISYNYKLPESFRGFVTDYWQKKMYLYWTSTIVVRKDALRKTGVFDERIRYGEDLDVWYRIILNFPVVFYNRSLAYYCTDAENRAMDKKILLDKYLPFYIEKYDEYRKNNPDFRKYFDRECLHRLFPYVLENKNNPELKRILNQIDFSQQKLSMRLRFMFPKLYNFYLKHHK